MFDGDRCDVVSDLLFKHVKSPSLRHIRDPYKIRELAQDIVNAVDRRTSLWEKWPEERESLLRTAASCWIPIEDLRQFFNRMAGPKLTHTDVEQRLRAIHEESYSRYPLERFRARCLAIYERETAEGTELPAIIFALQEFVENEEQRERDEWQAARRQQIIDEKAALEQRFKSGADCKWTPVDGSAALYCRINARTYRLTQTPDKRWDLERVTDAGDPNGAMIGRYLQRADVTKALSKVAYQPEPRW